MLSISLSLHLRGRPSVQRQRTLTIITLISIVQIHKTRCLSWCGLIIKAISALKTSKNYFLNSNLLQICQFFSPRVIYLIILGVPVVSWHLISFLFVLKYPHIAPKITEKRLNLVRKGKKIFELEMFTKIVTSMGDFLSCATFIIGDNSPRAVQK